MCKALIAALFAFLLPIAALSAEECTPAQQDMTMTQLCEAVDGEYNDFCEAWQYCHFPDQASVISWILIGVNGKKDLAKDASSWFTRWHYRSAITVAVVSFLATVFVAISRMSDRLARWFSIPAVVASALVTLCSSIVAIYAFDKGIIRSESTRAEYGKLESDIHAVLLRTAAKPLPDGANGHTVEAEIIDGWIKRLDDLNAQYVQDYLGTFSSGR